MRNWLLSLIVIFPSLLMATNFITVSNGNWTDNSTWSGGNIPNFDATSGSDLIIINNNVNLINNMEVKSGTNIMINDNKVLSVSGDVEFRNGAITTINGTLDVVGDFTLKNNVTTVNVNGTLTIDGDYEGGTGSELNGSGEMNITGTIITDGTGKVFGSKTDCITGDCSNLAGCNLDCAVLPVELISFECKYDTVMTIKWSTASEINNNYFILEHSVDGTKWAGVELISGYINSTSIIDYKTIHSEPVSGLNYYRLRQVDFDGTETLSKVIACRKEDDEIVSIKFYDLSGNVISEPDNGFYIKVVEYSNGLTESTKINKI